MATKRNAKRAELTIRQYVVVGSVVAVLYVLTLFVLHGSLLGTLVCRSLFGLHAVALGLYLRGWWSRWRFMVTPNRRLTVVPRNADLT